jgi:flagellar hook-length control protein FliK
MDIQQLLAIATSQASTPNPTLSRGQPGAFAHHMALAELPPGGDPTADAALSIFVSDDSARGILQGIAGGLLTEARDPSGADAALGRLAAFWPQAWGGAGTEELAELKASLAEAGVSQQQPADAESLTPELLDDLMQRLPVEARESLFAQLTERLTPEQAAALVAEITADLPAAEDSALFAEVTAAMPADQRAALLEQLMQRLPVEARESLFAQLTERLTPEQAAALVAEITADLPAAEGDALVAVLAANGFTAAHTRPLTESGQRLTADQRSTLLSAVNPMPVSVSQVLGQSAELATLTAAQTRDAVPSSGVLVAPQPAAEQQVRAALVEPDLLRHHLRSDARPAVTSPTGETRSSATTEPARSSTEFSLSAQITRDPLAPSLRDLLGLNLDSRDLAARQQGQNTGARDPSAASVAVTGSGLSSYSSIAGGQISAASAPQGMSAPLYSRAWPEQLGHQVVMLARRGTDQRVELRLNPPDLGPLTVSLKVGEQGTQIQFLAASAVVRGVVEQAIPQLREALAEQGIALGETSVGEQREDEPRQFAEKNASNERRTGESLNALDNAAAAEQTATSEVKLDGRVDLYA